MNARFVTFWRWKQAGLAIIPARFRVPSVFMTEFQPAKDRPAQAGFTRRIGIYLLTTSLMASYGAIFSLLAEIRDLFGFNAAGIGFIGAAAFASGFVAQIGLARLADTGYGARMLQIGLAICIASTAWMIFAESLAAWIVSRGLLGFGAGLVRPAVRRLIVVEDPLRAGRALGTLAAFETAGFLVGPVLAAALNTWFGFEMTFVALTVLLLLFAPTVLSAEVPAATVQPNRRVVLDLLGKPLMQACLLMGIAFWITIGLFEAIWAVFLSDLGASQVFIGLTMSLFGIPMVLISPIAGEQAQRLGSMRVATATLMVAMLCMVSYGFIDNIWWMCLPLLFHACADSYTMPATQLAVTEASGTDALAAGQGLFGATGMLVGALTAALGGVVYDLAGATGLWLGASLAMLLLVGGAQLLLARAKPHPNG